VPSKSISIPGFPHTHRAVPHLRVPDDQGIQILNIDHNPSAIALAASVCRNLQCPPANFRFLCAEAEDLARPSTTSSTLQAEAPTSTPIDSDSGACDLFGFDVVYLAALVGTTGAEKRRILKNIVSRMRPGALVVVRSAWGLRSLVYPVRLPLPAFLSLTLLS
jgi:nicotianamine synthase